MHLSSGGQETSAALIVTPSWLGLPERLGSRRVWGLAAQLYSVRSKRSWGVGDLTDLADLAVDELTDMVGLEDAPARELIMKAREHWFTA